MYFITSKIVSTFLPVWRFGIMMLRPYTNDFLFYIICHNYSISQRRYDQAIQAIKNSLGKEFLSKESMTLRRKD